MLIEPHRPGVLPAALLAALLGLSMPIATLSAAAAQTTTVPTPAPDSAEAKKQKIEDDRNAAFTAAEKVQKVGPQKVALRSQGSIDLPKGFIFVPQPEAGRILVALGNSDSPDTVGLFFPDGDEQQWWATLDFISSGYVKDEEAKNWNAVELLTNIKDGTEAANAERVERGFNPLEVTGWVEKPAYDGAAHQLVWSAGVRRKGASDDSGSVNYNTYALGRDGYFSLDLITGSKNIATDKARAKALLGGISYVAGKGYGDFNASTDHVAEYGIAALVGGIAAKKLGILALGAAFFLKFAKIIVVAVLAFGAGIMRLFRRKKPDQ